jgi:hypothetical protein
MQSEAIEAAGSNGRRLRLEFVWRNDRYQQIVSAIDAQGRVQVLLESIEGSATDDWPPSPPLQTLTVEQLPDGRRVALLLGMAGRSHWSASAEPLAGEAKIAVDLACRHASQAVWLGSRYRRVGDVGARLPVSEGEDTSLSDSGRVIDVQPLTIAAPATTRWRYVLSIEY